MPELPEVTVYVEALRRRIVGEPIEGIRLRSPSLLRTYDPPLWETGEKHVDSVDRLGKRIVWGLEGELFLVFHLMLAGRLRWEARGTRLPRKYGLAVFEFPHGALLLTEAGTKRRASLHLVSGREALRQFDRGGVDPTRASASEFRTALLRENRTLKRALTDQRILSGIGNAHSDEILHAARLSPVKTTRRLSEPEIVRLHEAARTVLLEWIERLRSEVGDAFPDRVTARHVAMRVHGKYGDPCPECGSPVQRIVYAENETNYCATCQTGGSLLRDRALSRLLGVDWPTNVDELEPG